MPLRSRLLAAAVALVVAGPHAFAQPIAADTPEKTAGGASFTLPKAWAVEAKGPVVVASPPEADTRVAIVDVAAAPDAAAATASAWRLWRPEAHRAPKLVTARPPRDGWDEQKVLDYETSPNEKKIIQAVTARVGTRWTVAILDAP